MKTLCIVLAFLLFLCVTPKSYSTNFYIGDHTASTVELYRWDWDGNDSFTNPEHINSFANVGSSDWRYGVGMSFASDNHFYMGYHTASTVELYRWDWDGNDSFTNPIHVNSFANVGSSDWRYSVGMSFAYDNHFYMGYHTASTVELYRWDWDGNDSFTNPVHVNSFANVGSSDWRYSVGMSFSSDNYFYMGYHTASTVELYRWDWDGNDSFTNPVHVNSFANVGSSDWRYSVGMSAYPIAVPEPMTLILTLMASVSMFIKKRIE